MEEYEGKTISLTTVDECRFVGVLINLNVDTSSVTLENVKIFGTEDRPAAQYQPPQPQIAPSMTFTGDQISDITILDDEPVNTQPPRAQPPEPQVTTTRPPAHTQKYEAPKRRAQHPRNRQPAGELKADPNAPLKATLGGEFDLSTAVLPEPEEKHQEPEEPKYNPKMSFFDNISSELTARKTPMEVSERRREFQRRRETDMETFGETNARLGGHRRRGGYRRYGNRNYGYHQNRNHHHHHHHHHHHNGQQQQQQQMGANEPPK